MVKYAPKVMTMYHCQCPSHQAEAISAIIKQAKKLQNKLGKL